MKTHRLSARITEAESEKFMASAKALNVSRSSLARSLLTIPLEFLEVEVSDEEKKRIAVLAQSQNILVYDRATFRNLHMQLRRWGYHYNQAVHALNTIAAKRFMRPEDAETLMEKAVLKLEDIAQMREELVAQIARLEHVPKVLLE